MKKKTIIGGLLSISLNIMACVSGHNLSHLSREELNKLILEDARKNTPKSGYSVLGKPVDPTCCFDKILPNQMQSRRFIFPKKE